MILRSVKSFVKSTELIRRHGSVITKEYMEDTKVFADVFNHMTYQGEKVIDPKNLEEMEHFTSNFREVMQFIKYSEDAEKLERLVKANAAFATVDRKAVRVMEEMTGMKIEKEARGEKVNVCKGILGIEEKGRAAGREEGREEGRAEGRAEGVSAGIQREQKLTRSLLRDNRLDDLKRALDDPAFRQKLCEEYGID